VSAAGHEAEHRRGVGALAPTAEVSRRRLPARAFAARSFASHRDLARRTRNMKYQISIVIASNTTATA
jgi:hypothetical protein